MRFFATIALLFGVTQAIKINQPVAPENDALAVLSMLQREGRNRGPSKGEIVNILGWLTMAVEKSDTKSLDEAQVLAACHAYVQHHGIKASDDEIKSVAGQILKNLDMDGDKHITKDELLKGLFGMIDKDQNGRWDKREFIGLIRAYGKFLKVDPKEDWKKIVKGWYDHIDPGLTPDELIHFLNQHNHTIHGLKDAVESMGEKRD